MLLLALQPIAAVYIGGAGLPGYDAFGAPSSRSPICTNPGVTDDLPCDNSGMLREAWMLIMTGAATYDLPVDYTLCSCHIHTNAWSRRALALTVTIYSK